MLCCDKWNLVGTKYRGKRKEGVIKEKVFKEEIIIELDIGILRVV